LASKAAQLKAIAHLEITDPIIKFSSGTNYSEIAFGIGGVSAIKLDGKAGESIPPALNSIHAIVIYRRPVLLCVFSMHLLMENLLPGSWSRLLLSLR
jgi:hypothetical protein